MNILMLSSTFPYPPTGGTPVRTFNFLKYLKEQGHTISLGTLRTGGVSDEDIANLKDWVDDLGVFPRIPHAPSSNPVIRALGKAQRLANFAINGRPPSVIDNHCEALQTWANERIDRKSVV